MESTATARALENKDIEPSGIKGWGVDADPENDPTYPMKTRIPEIDHEGYNWERPPQQPEDVEVLHSNERPNVSATFGTSVPPSGLSGVIRRVAFKHSEDRYRHWLPLMLADRVQVVEGLVSDLAHGTIPNIPGELGWGAEWKYDRARLVRKVAIGAGIAIAAYALFRPKREDAEYEVYPDPALADGDEAYLGRSL